jgi:hypothetical protein
VKALFSYRAAYFAQSFARKARALSLLFAAVAGSSLLPGCSEKANVLAPYLGERPYIILTVTKSPAPDIQWVGGRAAALGVNVGDKAALDSTLVWLTTADDDAISSPIRFGADANEQEILAAGGHPLDSLSNNQVYTFWIAEADAFSAGLDKASLDPFTFVDSTLEVTYLLRGRSAGDPSLGVEFTVMRDQHLSTEVYRISWTPADQPFRRIVINAGSSGSLKDGIAWHIVVPDDQPDSILPPLTIGTTPDGALLVKDWQGFSVSNHILWAQTSDWDGESFGLRTKGYAQFLIFKNNFE